MSNPNNTANVIGKLAAAPKFFQHKDGSNTVVFTVYSDNNFKSRNGDWGSQAIPVEVFLSASTDVQRTPFSGAATGDLVSISAHLELQTYTKNGGTVRELKLIGDDFWFLEPRSARAARAAKKSEAATTAPQAAEPAAAAASPVQDEQLPFGAH